MILNLVDVLLISYLKNPSFSILSRWFRSLEVKLLLTWGMSIGFC